MENEKEKHQLVRTHSDTPVQKQKSIVSMAEYKAIAFVKDLRVLDPFPARACLGDFLTYFSSLFWLENQRILGR